MSDPSSSTSPAHRSLWRSKLLLAMTAVTLLGVVLWVYAAATRPAPTPHASPAATSLATGLVPTDPSAGTAAPGSVVDPRLVDEAAPAVARFGGSFIAGFCIAYAFRKMIKVAALVTGVALIALFALDRAGMIQVNTQLITDSLERGVAWVRGEAGAMKDFVLGYLPSAGAGTTGIIMGLRKK